MAATIADIWGYVAGSAKERQIWQQVAERYLPGALTLVLPASENVPSAMNPKDPTTIGVRVPNHPIAQLILRQTGPLATTSANRSGQPPLLSMSEIEHQFPQVVTLLHSEIQTLEQHPSTEVETSIASGIPSTVARWTGTEWEVLRQGAVVIEL